MVTNFDMSVSNSKQIISNTLYGVFENSYPWKWDEQKDQPELERFSGNKGSVSPCYGGIAKLKLDLKLKFKNVRDIKLKGQLRFDGKMAGEVIIEDNSEVFVELKKNSS